MTRIGAAVIAQGRKRSKYGVDRSELGKLKREYNGVRYDSELEARYARVLDLLVKEGKVRGWERQIAFPLFAFQSLSAGRAISAVITKIVIDFKVWHMDDRLEYVECKGMETPLYKLKKKMFDACYPDIKITMIRK